MYKISKDIPPPPARSIGKRKDAFFALAVGESFFVPGKTTVQIGPSANKYGKELGVKFTCAQWTEDGASGTRVWRIK